MQHDAAYELDAEGLHAQHSPGRLPRHGKGLGQDTVQVLARLVARLELVRLGAQLLVGERLHLRLQRLDLIRDRIYPFQLVVAVRAEEFL